MHPPMQKRGVSNFISYLYHKCKPSLRSFRAAFCNVMNSTRVCYCITSITVYAELSSKSDSLFRYAGGLGIDGDSLRRRARHHVTRLLREVRRIHGRSVGTERPVYSATGLLNCGLGGAAPVGQFHRKSRQRNSRMEQKNEPRTVRGNEISIHIVRSCQST